MIIAVVGALTLLALVGWRARLSPPAVAGQARALQAACACEHCVSKDNTVSDCESFGIDCACYSGAGGGGGAGTCDDLADRTAAVNDECCDEATEDCSSGTPASCNAGCAELMLPFRDACLEELTQNNGRKAADQMRAAANTCASGDSGVG